MLVSVFVSSISSVPLTFLDESSQNWTYPLIALQGIGIAIMLNTATALISDIIGRDSENSAFVYGCFSMFDKCANGVLIFYIIATYSEDADALKVLMGTVPTMCSIFCFVFAWIGNYFYSDRLTKISEITSLMEEEMTV
jgi:MFS family permease